MCQKIYDFEVFSHFWNNRFCLTFYNIYKISPRFSEIFTLPPKQYCIVKKMKKKIQILIFRDLSVAGAQCLGKNSWIFQFLHHVPPANKCFKNLKLMELGQRETAKIHEKLKICIFCFFLELFHPFESFHDADKLFKNVQNTIFGLPSLQIWKNP